MTATAEVICRDDELTLPHPLAHLRAFVLVPWLAVDPDADADGGRRAPARRAAAGRARSRRARRGAARPTCVLWRLMGPTRKRDLTAATVVAARPRLSAGDRARTGGFRRSRCGPGCRCWRSRSPRAAGRSTCGRRSTTARSATGRAGCIRWRWPASVMIAKASAWVGALVLGWWVGVLVYLLPRRGTLRVAGEDTAGAVVAAVSALALLVAALWLQHCCKSPQEPPDNGEGAPE